MKRWFITFVLSLVMVYSQTSFAKTLVMVHGFQGDEKSWYKHHVVDSLLARGWQDLTYLDAYQAAQVPKAQNAFFAIRLPWFAPIESQAQMLAESIEKLHQQRGGNITLVGHSVGGVVARFVLLARNDLPIDALITIASPHQGTPWADFAWQATQTPIDNVMCFLGKGQWKKAKLLLWDLSPENKANLLHWMNAQTHPKDVRYVSIVHTRNFKDLKMDIMVPETSQDLRNVPSLRGSAISYPIDANHQLNRRDGELLAYLLSAV